MNTRLKRITYIALIAVMISLSTAVQAQTRVYYVTDRQVQTVLIRIETRTDAFKQEIDRVLDNSNVDGTGREDSINTMIANFENATDRLRNNFASSRSTSADVQEVLSRAVFVNSFMRNNRVSSMAQSQWNQIRADLNTLAGYYRVSSNWNANPGYPVPIGRNPYFASDGQVRGLLAQIETRTDAFKRQIDRNLDRSYDDGTIREDSINTMIANFETATDRLRDNFTSRRSTTADVQEVLNRAVGVNNFMRTYRGRPGAQNSWNQIRADLDTLAGYYRVASNWNTTVIPGPGTQFGSFDTRLTGTYRLNTAQSDNVDTIVNRAIINANYNVNQRDRMQRNLERRLAAPITLTLEKRGQQVTMSSANGQSVTLDADGVTSTSARGPK